MFFKSKRSFAERGILFSILFGILGYLVSAGFIYKQIKPTTTTFDSIQEVRLAILDTTYTNLGIPIKKNYLHDLNELNLKHGIKYDLIERPGYSYKKSRLFEDLIFSSQDEASLHFAISGLDLKYAKMLGKEDIPNPYFMNKNPKIALWVLLISIAVGFSFFLTPLFYAEIKRYSCGLQRNVKIGNIMFAIIIFILLVVPLFLPPLVYPGILFKPTDTSIYFDSGFNSIALMYGATVPFISTIFWLILIFTVNSKISQLYKESAKALVTKFNSIKEDVERYFIVMAFFLAFTIFCTDTLLSTLNSLSINQPTLFPREFAFSNGLIQTFFLILIYFGIQANFSNIKKGINSDATITDKEKEGIVEQQNFFNYVKVVLTMLAPLIGSGLQDVIGIITG